MKFSALLLLVSIALSGCVSSSPEAKTIPERFSIITVSEGKTNVTELSESQSAMVERWVKN